MPTKDIPQDRVPMSFVTQLRAPESLTLDWYQRHPALDRVTIHVVGLNAEDIAVSVLPPDVQDAIAAVDAALAAYVTELAGLPCVPDAPVVIDAEPIAPADAEEA